MADNKFDLHHFDPPGPVGAAFLTSLSPLAVIMGPAGSGKTVVSAYRGPLLASHFAAVCKDGVIRVRQATIRDTYRDLARTCLATWHEFFPPDGPLTKQYEGGQDRPIKHTLTWDTIRDGCRVPVEFVMQFGAIGDANLESFIKGYELTFGWGNECDLLNIRTLPLLLQRTGRYPRIADIHPLELKRLRPVVEQQFAAMGTKLEPGEVALPRMVWGDMNPPDIGHDLYKILVKEKAQNPGWAFFKQPSGLSPNAENRAGKPRSSYELEERTMDKYDVRRYVHGEFGWSRDGQPVYPEFREQEMVADQPIDPVPGLPIGIGLDAGGSPACGIGQFQPNGQLRMLAEICCDPGTGPSRFSEMILEVLMSRFRGFPVSEGFGDPAAYMGADRMNGELAYMELVARAINVSIMPTVTNEVGIRQEAVRWYLGAPIDAHTPRLLIDPRCERTIGGFAAHYKLTKQATSGATDKLIVAKNEYSHIHDAWQYLCLGHRGRAAVIKDGSQLGRAANVVPIRQHVAKTDFDVFSV